MPDNVRREAADRIESFRIEFSKFRVRWTRAENMHVTLKFLGDTSERQISQFSPSIAAELSKLPAFDVVLGQPGAFSNRVLTVAVGDPEGGLARTADIIETHCRLAGIPSERRSLQPHLTLGRLRSQKGSADLISEHLRTPFTTSSWRISEIVLFESKLTSTGPIYTKLRTFPLGIAN